MAGQFNRSVFVNCPFDQNYVPLLRPLLFTVLSLGFKPRIALESLDSGGARINKIMGLVGSCRLAIHDLSRIKSGMAGEFARLNMPFELGLDIGCRTWGTREHHTKKCLILGAEKYGYQAALSDLSNSDIAVHANDPATLVPEVRNWLENVGKLIDVPGGALIWVRYNEFFSELYAELEARGFAPGEIDRFQVGEFIDRTERWLSRRSA